LELLAKVFRKGSDTERACGPRRGRERHSKAEIWLYGRLEKIQVRPEADVAAFVSYFRVSTDKQGASGLGLEAAG
jgi:hypothetical protein